MKSLKLLFPVILSLFVISGCASMADMGSRIAGLGVISTEESTFDGETTISVSPNWLYETESTWSANSVKMGARWSTKFPEHVVIDLAYESDSSGYKSVYLNLQGVEVNIDGVKSSYEATGSTTLDHSSYNTVSKTIYTSSENSIVMELSELKKMVHATDCRVRIHTSKGYEDSLFHIERASGGGSAAKYSIIEFLAEIEAFRQAKGI